MSMYDYRGRFIEQDDEWTTWCDVCLGDLLCSDAGCTPRFPAREGDAVCSECGGDLDWRERDDEEEETNGA